MSSRRLTHPIAIAVLTAWFGQSPLARASLTPSEMEKEVLRISRNLHPIPDDQWREIAGDRAEERYAIVKGDTLYDISKRLFGDSRYWPKIWALNNDTITNPHLIRPGNTIAFMQGTGTDVPLVKIDTGTSTVGSDDSEEGDEREAQAEEPAKPEPEPPKPKRMRRSQEWKKLPPQEWDRFGSQLQKRVIEIGMGFNKEDQLVNPVMLSFEPEMIVASDVLTPMAEIESSNTMGIYPFLNEIAVIRSNVDLRIGEVYAIAGDSEKLISPREDNPAPGYAYEFAGQVKILEKRGDVYLGKIAQARDTIERGSILVPLPKRIPSPLHPKPAPREFGAHVIINHRLNSYMSAQHSQVILDRGTGDGVDVGMVFRVYQHNDRATQQKFTDENIIQYGELIVIQTSERYSLALVTRSDYPIEQDDVAFIQTDVGSLSSTPEVKPQPQGNELDIFQQEDTLSPQEKKELKQLEKWKSNPSPTPAPSASPGPSGTPLEPAPAPSPAPAPAPTPEAPAPAPAPAPTDLPQPPPAPNEAAPTPPAASSDLPPPPAPGEAPPPPPVTDVPPPPPPATDAAPPPAPPPADSNSAPLPPPPAF